MLLRLKLAFKDDLDHVAWLAESTKDAAKVQLFGTYRGTSLIRNSPPHLGPPPQGPRHSTNVGSYGRGGFL